MGVYLSQPKTEKLVKTGTGKGLKYTSCEMQGWRKSMQDARIADVDVKAGNKSYCVFGVFDGHGGGEVSRFVEAHFVEELAKNQNFKKGDVSTALEQTFRKMDELIQAPESCKEIVEYRKTQDGWDGGLEEDLGRNAGCTANVLVFDSEFYWVANSGDSRSALCRGGKLVVLSQDHKPQSETEKKRIEKAGGVIMNGRVNGGLNLTRAIGDFQYKNSSGLSYKQQMITCHPDIVKVARRPEDEFIIMGCDGIWEKYVNDSQLLLSHLTDQRKKQSDSSKLMQDLLDFLLAKTTTEELGCDNMTAILIEFTKN